MSDDKNVKHKQVRMLLVVMGLGAVLAGCASTGEEKTQPESTQERAQMRWTHILQGEIEEAYAYLSPGYRSSVDLGEYQKIISQKKVGWTDAKVIDSDCSENSCKVRIMLNYRLIAAVPGVQKFDGKQLINENWILSDGQWWYIPPN